MTDIGEFGQRINDYERQEEIKRHHFLERMTQKLRFKESIHRDHRRQLFSS
jgi:hypothetical protein